MRVFEHFGVLHKINVQFHQLRCYALIVCCYIGIDNTFPIEVGVRFAPNSDYRTMVQIKAPKNPPVSRLISSRRFQALRGSRSNYADSPRPFDPRERHDLILEHPLRSSRDAERASASRRRGPRISEPRIPGDRGSTCATEKCVHRVRRTGGCAAR